MKNKKGLEGYYLEHKKLEVLAEQKELLEDLYSQLTTYMANISQLHDKSNAKLNLSNLQEHKAQVQAEVTKVREEFNTKCTELNVHDHIHVVKSIMSDKGLTVTDLSNISKLTEQSITEYLNKSTINPFFFQYKLGKALDIKWINILTE